MYDLPSEDPEEPGLPDIFHELQPQMLQLTFRPEGWEEDRIFSATDLNLYYDLNHPLWHKRPDWFGVVGVDRLYERHDLRLSYVIWQEKISPFVVVELLSPGTEAEDLGETVSQIGQPPTKWQVYGQILKIPYYAIFSRYTDELQAFHLVGDDYEPVDVSQGYLSIPELELRLGTWRGNFRRYDRLWLRWMKPNGDLILLPEEETKIVRQQATEARQQATEARQQATEARQQATEAEQRVAKLEAKLRELEIDPDEIV
jgi:Uma2 family endonuclease